MNNMKSFFCISWIVAATVMLIAVQHAIANDKVASQANTKVHSIIGQVKEINEVSDSGRTSVHIHVESGNILLDEFRVLFDNKSGKALDAWWMTKGMFKIALPKAGLLLKSVPKQGSQVRVHFDRDAPKDYSSVYGIRLLSIAEAKPVRKPKAVNFLTVAQVRQIEQRIPKLKKGMTETEVFKTLGFKRIRAASKPEHKVQDFESAYCSVDSVNISGCARAAGNHGATRLSVVTLARVARALVQVGSSS
jgi:hypothetical protein